MTGRPTAVVSRALSAAGIPVGYRYTQTGYVDRDRRPLTAPGADVTRRRKARYGGVEDLGHVAVHLVEPTTGNEPPEEFIARAEAALRSAGLPVTRRGATLIVPDDEEVLSS